VEICVLQETDTYSYLSWNSNAKNEWMWHHISIIFTEIFLSIPSQKQNYISSHNFCFLFIAVAPRGDCLGIVWFSM
jgi:hypothetical protein